MSHATAQEILEAARKGASVRRAETLNHLQDACDYLAPTGRFKLRDIEAYVRRVYGEDAAPRAQTISNERSRDFGMYTYVEARRREAAGKLSKQPGLSLDRAVEEIKDIDLRNLMRDMVDRLKLAENAALRAKAVLKTLHPGANIDDLIAGRPQADVSNTFSASDFTVLQRIAATLMNEDALRSCGLTFDGSVRRRGGTYDELFDAATIARFRQIVDRLSPS